MSGMKSLKIRLKLKEPFRYAFNVWTMFSNPYTSSYLKTQLQKNFQSYEGR